MQIDIAGASQIGAPTIEPNSASSEAPASGPGSFADLLNAAADESPESTPAGEADDEDVAGDEWMTIPVFVPSLVIPQEVIEDGPAGTNVEAAIDAGSSIDVSLEASESAPSSVVSPLLARGAPVAAEKSEAAPVVDSQPTAASASSAAVGNIAEAGESEAVVGNTASALSTESSSKASAAQPAATTKPEAMPKATESVDAKASPAAEASPAASASHGVPREGASPRAELPLAEAQSEPAARAKGVAARFARALERAAEPSAVQRAEVAAGDQGQSFDQSGDEQPSQPSLGEWLREQLPLAAARTQPMGTSTFGIVSPLQNDARVGGMLASAAGNVTPGAPAMPSERDVTLQIVQSMRMQFRDGIGEAVLTLKPEHLGSVSISLRVENGGLKASVQAEMPEVRQWLQSQQDTLRSALSEHGLRLDRFDVEPDGRRQSSSSDTRDEEPTRKRQPRRSAQADEPVFEVVV